MYSTYQHKRHQKAGRALWVKWRICMREGLPRLHIHKT